MPDAAPVTRTTIPETGTPEFDKFVREVVRHRYPKMVADGISDREWGSLLGVAEKWVDAVARAARVE